MSSLLGARMVSFSACLPKFPTVFNLAFVTPTDSSCLWMPDSSEAYFANLCRLQYLRSAEIAALVLSMLRRSSSIFKSDWCTRIIRPRLWQTPQILSILAASSLSGARSACRCKTLLRSPTTSQRSLMKPSFSSAYETLPLDSLIAINASPLSGCRLLAAWCTLSVCRFVR